jgi:amino acid transporter
MTETTEATPAAQSSPADPALVRQLTLRDLVLFNVVAVLGLRWVATSAKAGASALVLWLLAAALFFVPQGLAVIALSSRYPEEGGIYAWAKRTFGEGHGFLCGWCYWINNVLYYPNLLISTAVIATYAIGRGETTLGSQWPYVLTTTLAALWFATALNVVGVGTGKWLQNVGAVATYVPGVALIALGAYAAATRPPANPFTWRTLTPDLGDLGTLNLWASVAFAFSGLELSSALGGEVRDPERTLPRAVYVAAPLVALAYVLGAAALLWLVPTGEINIVSGFLQGVAAGGRVVGPSLWWLAPVAAALYTVSNIGGVGAWLAGPARVAFAIGLDRYFPPAFGRVHPRWRTPYVAILVQAVLATLFLLLSVLGKGSTVEHAYLVLLDTQILVYFIPFLYLFACLLAQLRRPAPAGERTARFPGGRAGARVAGLAGLGVTIFAMVVAAIPPADSPDRLAFVAKVVGGALAFVVAGLWMYWRARRAPRPRQ